MPVYNLDSLISRAAAAYAMQWHPCGVSHSPPSSLSLTIYQTSTLVSCTNFSQLQTSIGKDWYLHITFGSVHSFTPEIRMIKHTANWTIGKVLPDMTVDIFCVINMQTEVGDPISVSSSVTVTNFLSLMQAIRFPICICMIKKERYLYTYVYVFYQCVQNMSAVNIH